MQLCFKIVSTAEKRKQSVSKQTWTIDADGFLRYQNRLLMSDEKSIRVKLLKRYYDDKLTKHYDVIKTTNFSVGNIIDWT